MSLCLLQSVLLAVQFNSNFILVLLLCGPLSLPLFLLPPFLPFPSLSSQKWVYWSFGALYIMYPLDPSHVIDEFVLLLWTENASMLLRLNRTTTGNVTHKQRSQTYKAIKLDLLKINNHWKMKNKHKNVYIHTTLLDSVGTTLRTIKFFMGNSFYIRTQWFTWTGSWKDEDVIFSTAMEVLTALF